MVTGRELELRRARTAVTRGRGVAIVGAAGVGKTALASALVEALDREHCSTVRISGTEASRPIPYGALAELITGEHEPVEPALVFGRIVREIARRAGRRTPVVFVDDAHLLDGPSAAALLALVIGRHARVIVTVRGDEPAPDAITSLHKDHGLERLDLAPFGRACTAAVVEAMLDGEVAASTIDLLHQWTGGNALFLCELVRAGRSEGHLVVEAGLWWWQAPLSVPPALAELLDRRIDGLTSEERDAVAAVALGEPLSLEVLEAASSPAIAAHLEDLELIRVDEAGDRLLVRLDHPLLRAAVQRQSPSRRRRVAARLLAAAQIAPGRVDAVSRAIWQLEARGEVDVELLLGAAETILHTDPELAARLARRSLEKSGSVRAAAALADALVESGDSDAARAVLERARDEALTPEDSLTAAVALAAHRAWAERSPEEAHVELATLRAVVPAGPGRDELDSVDALVLLFAARTAEALEIADRLTASGVTSQASMRGLLVRAAGLTIVGRTEDALAAAEAVVRAPQAALAGLPYARGMGLAALALAQLWRTPLGAVPSTDPARGRWPTGLGADTLGTEPTAWPLFDGYVRRVMGDREGAISRLREALVQQSGGEGLFRSEAAAWLALSLAESGRPEEAEAVLATQAPDAVAIVPGLLPWARAGVAVARGHRSAARHHLDEAITAARRAGCNLVELGYLTYSPDLQRAGRPMDLARLRKLLPQVDAPRLVASAEAFLALFTSDGPQLLEHAGRLESYGLRLAALELAEAAREALRPQPRLRAEATLLAGSLRKELGVALNDPARPCDLTPREAEVMALAAGGMSDRDIAGDLVLSVRTVETHLARVYRKLGITSRQDLAQLATIGLARIA